ncbi:hypothetical protein [Flavobacterium sp.]|uniref:hypothetical protein n=1 Tax=Flavobacterium sp. TaxID=239 RepID=UPI00262DF57F|nr:hypothetical protein [Flavobacterium sp.]
MDIISEDMFYDFLEKGESIKDKKINLKYVDLKKIQSASFYNCNFTGSQIQFGNSENKEQIENKVTIYFENCSFNNLLIMGIKNIENLSFFYTEKAKQIDIFSCNLNRFIFQNNVDIDFEIKMHFCEFHEMFYVYSNEFLQNGVFNLVQNTFYQYSTIKNNLFNNLNFSKQYFKDFLVFENKSIKGSIFSINQSEFEKASFSESEFTNLTFQGCDFYSTTWFENCNKSNDGILKIIACKFEKYTLFDNSKFNKIEILRTKFLDKASFENIETNDFIIHQATFVTSAYFEELNKIKVDVIENWDRKTLRAIKRELVNTHNQIDYLRFKAYELNAYKKEIDKDKLSWKDSLILYFNQESNNFGLDWTKGIQFIFQWSFIFYILYIISYAARIDEKSNLPNVNDFLVNYLKFTNPLSFLNPPLKNSEDYFLPLIALILGKIFVSYGIYQTIQAFRKFGVNGG